MNIAEALRFAERLSSDTAKLDTEVLLAFSIQKTRTYLYTWPERALTQDQVKEFQDLITRRMAGEPVAYLVRQKDFWSLPIEVDASTLIPRPDTEVLVESALNFVDPLQAMSILDLGTGSGAIALALAKECSYARVMGVDVQEAAVSLANKNLKQLNINNVEFTQSHWFDSVDGTFDLIVSNPPYIDESDPHLNQGDVRFEPATALIAADGGFADLRTIIQQAPNYLNRGAYLLLEHGFEQSEQVRALFAECGYRDIFTRKDYGDNERVTGACWSVSDG